MNDLLITIDGPAGAGKSTVSQRLASRLGYIYVDTGALYRSVALAAASAGCASNDEIGLGSICRRLRLRFVNGRDGPRLYYNGEDITERIRTPEITMLASEISARPVVREYLINVQRDIGKNGGAVFEGRDMGTVVFPEAGVKFYLYADPETRAVRRYKELLSTDETIGMDEVRNDMIKRDKNDSGRALAPLRPADDAISIDSTDMGIEEVVDLMLHHVETSRK